MTNRDWVTETLGKDAFERLSHGLAGSELQSLLLEVMRQRAEQRAPKDVLAQFQRDKFCLPAVVDQRVSLEVDRHLLAAAPQFEAIELSPVAPLGTCSTVAPTTQNRVLSALRSTEVVSDPTNVLALECAARLRREPNRPAHLATSQRVIRAQPVPNLPGYAQHFRIFVLSSGGVEAKDHAFTIDTTSLHIRTTLAAFDELERHGYSFGQRRVKLFATDQKQPLAQRIAENLGGLAELHALTHAYYSGGLRFQIWVNPPGKASMPLTDGGTFDWLTRLCANRRAVFVATGTGAQLIPLRFRNIVAQ